MSKPCAHQLDGEILREYDLRGEVAKNFGPEDVYAVGRAFGSVVHRGGGRRVAVGYDGRLSSPELEASLVKGLSDSGISAVRVGCGPTPMISYAGEVLDVSGAMMITGSHNPPEYNGIKLTLEGKPFFAENIQKIGKMAAEGDYVEGDAEPSDHAIFETYVDRVFQDFKPGKDLTVAWDPGNGSGGEVVEALIKRLPGTHYVINGEIDGNFPAHHPDPTVEENLEQLKELVAEKKCDLGFAFDGDADRIGLIDSQGRILWGDQILILLARDVLKELPGATIIADIKASQVFVDEITRMGGKPLIWKTGHSLIKSKMLETGSPLAGEMSAHIFFKHGYYGFDDALYAAVRLLSIIARADESLDDMRDAMPQMLNTPEIRFDCPEDRKFKVAQEIQERMAGQDNVDIMTIDGVRVTNEDGWWLIRASNTQAVLVARCESSTAEGLRRLKTELVRQLKASGINAPDLD